MRIGVILVGHNMEEHVAPCLQGWVEWRTQRAALGHDDLRICAVSSPFEGFPNEPLDGTRDHLRSYLARGEIDQLITSDAPLKETAARGAALRWLMGQQVDIVWQLDLDERYTERDLRCIVAFVEANPLVAWFRLSLRNAVFSPTTYLAEPFTPSRIHRARVGGYRLHSFCDDNDLLYGGTITRDLKRQDQFASMTVPASCSLVRHLSWISDDRSRRKCEYQLSRGWDPSFRWDYEANQLRFNEAHFARRGLPLPEIVHE